MKWKLHCATTRVRMDFYDPQTLGVMVFGGFMLVSAIGIFLVSTFSMKETSYEEALANQRKEMEKASQQKVEKKKKERPAEKKGKAKKKEEKPNGRIAESDLSLDTSDGFKDVSPESAVVVEPTVFEPLVLPLSAPPQEKEKITPSPKDKKKKEKKVIKGESPSSLAAPPPLTSATKPQVSDAAPKEVSVVSVPPGGVLQNVPLTTSATVKNSEALGNQENDGTSKKKPISKKKRESVTADAENALYLPYQTLISTINSMVFGDGEMQQLIEILTEKAGGVQDTWHTATQKGDPVAVLKRQLEEREKQLATEQENATAAKAKLREFTKELAVEKAKTLASENKLKEQLLTHQQEMAAIQARMQASYQDHVTEIQQLQGKIRTLQEQLENGPNTQLARLQQENSILRDALNQATSQTESKQNAELAKLRQECSKRSKELTEKLDVLQQTEEQKKVLEMKTAAYEGQIYQLQVAQKEKEAALQKRLDEITEELHKSQANYKSLQKEQQSSLAELQSKLLCSETEVKSKVEELKSLQAKLSGASYKTVQLAEQAKLSEDLEADQLRKGANAKDMQAANQSEVSMMQLRLQESSTKASALEEKTAELKDMVEQLKIKNNDLREKNWAAMEALASSEKACEAKVLSSAKAKEASEQQLAEFQAQTKQVLLSLFPQVTLNDQQAYNEWLQQFKEQASVLQQKNGNTESGMALSLAEANEALSTLHAECNQYRTILAETEGMLKDLQKSVEEEEQVWKAKLAASEEALQKSQDQMKCLEDDVKKCKMELQDTNKVWEYVKSPPRSAGEQLRQLLSESQEHLATAQTEALKQSQELAQVRQQLSEMKSHVLEGEVAGSQTDPSTQEPLELKTQLEQTKVELYNEHVLRDKLTAEFEEAQTSVCRLQDELEKLRLDGNVASTTTEDVLQLQERLEKEKKLTKDLGCAATKLKELLKITQEQLTKERETVMKLQEQLQEREENKDNAKEGTSV
ncbi:hypothetical protein lerEdw1_005131 [Lerista edwardsae]|nr:hypothetical protein lerEdw1_005131 [Lerista edwardsae]